MSKSPLDELTDLRNQILYHNNLYYKENRQEISDKEYDSLLSKLKRLEKKYPEFDDPNSPSKAIGSDITNSFEKVKHSVPVLSLENTYNLPELTEWASKVGFENEFSVEWKIDGASILLYYVDGELKTAATRGTGGEGDDVTENVKTIRSLPTKLKSKLTISVRGEIFMNFSDFEEFNENYGGKFANPRNLAAGSIKHKYPSEVAKRPLSIIVYDGFFPKGRKGISSHKEILRILQEEGLPIGPDTKSVKGADLEKTVEQFRKRKESMNFPVDGLVIKLDSLPLRESLGETAHSPRWARAFKFDALLKETIIEDISVATGRTGKITPRAKVSPINLAGTTVTYATLHNQDYINELGAGIGARVLVSKRGEIIPAVEKVIQAPTKGIYQIPKNCPTCGSILGKVEESVDLFCQNRACPERVKNSLIFFCAKKQMNIEGLGEKQIHLFYEKGWLRSIPDIYRLENHFPEMLEMEGYGEKSIALLKKGIDKSKEKDFRFVLPSLGLEEVGHKVTEILIENGLNSWDALLALSKQKDGDSKLNEIHGIGPRTVESLLSHLKDKQILTLVNDLKKLGLKLEGEKLVLSDKQPFLGQSWCVSGSFENFQPREKALELIVKHGGKKVSSVSSKTNCLLYGPGAGSKLEKAKELNIKTVDEAEFLDMLKKEGINPFE